LVALVPLDMGFPHLSEFMLSWEWYCGALSALRCLLSNYYNIESFAVNLGKNTSESSLLDPFL
jgi:hypothetical protein